MIHRKKNAPALQRLDISTVSLVSSCFREFAYVFFYPGVSGSVLLNFFFSGFFSGLCLPSYSS